MNGCPCGVTGIVLGEGSAQYGILKCVDVHFQSYEIVKINK